MSASLIVLLPVILLGIVGLSCFVGCGFPTSGESPSFTGYSGVVLGTPSIMAYWPLLEANDSLPAADLAPNPDPGQYIDPNTDPDIYPWPGYSIVNPPGPNVLSAPAPGDNMSGTILFAQPGIVTGDYGTGDTDSGTKSGCVVVNGCFVNVPFAPKINPTSFTLEAWVRVDWSETDLSAWRAVLDARTLNPTCTGFAILAMADPNTTGLYHWSAVVGNGGTGEAGFTFATSPDAITLSGQSTLAGATTFYLAVTYDAPSKTLTLFVNGEQSGPAVISAYVPNAANPLWIGAGVPYVAMRTPQTPQSMVASPLVPFVGALQDIAIYNKALAPPVIQTRFNNGNGFN
jgi:hypothetical protein